MIESPPEAFIETAILAANTARRVIMKYFRKSFDVITKNDGSPLTCADRETERAIKELILTRHPTHSFLGEEGGSIDRDEKWRWVVDPIDGTKSFVTGNPTFGTLIALLHEDIPVIGLIDHCALNERWIGVAGRATTHNGVPCTTDQTARIDESTLYATHPDMFVGEAVQQFGRLSTAVRLCVFGGDCYAYGLLASGWTGLVCEASLKAHDFLALVPVVDGAGGVITDWHGRGLTKQSNGQVLAAANPILHAAALDKLKQNDHLKKRPFKQNDHPPQ